MGGSAEARTTVHRGQHLNLDLKDRSSQGKEGKRALQVKGQCGAEENYGGFGRIQQYGGNV